MQTWPDQAAVSPLTKCSGWSWLRQACFRLNRFISILNFGPFCTKMDNTFQLHPLTPAMSLDPAGLRPQTPLIGSRWSDPLLPRWLMLDLPLV